MPLSPFIFNFVIDLLIESSPPVTLTFGFERLPGFPFVDIEYVDDVALLGSDPSEMRAILNKLNNSAALFGMRFTPSKCKVLLQDWLGSNPNLLLADEPISVVDHFCYISYNPPIPIPRQEEHELNKNCIGGQARVTGVL